MRQTEESYYHSRVYQDFKGIEQNEFRNIVRFFESRTDEIVHLEFNEYFELLTQKLYSKLEPIIVFSL